MAKSKRIYYTMGQVSEMFDLAPSTIRFWEKRFKILNPRKNAKGNRLFTPEDVENLKLIYHLTKEKKMTLEGAEHFIMQRRVATKGEMSVVEILQKIRSTLVEIRQEIETSEQPVEHQIIVRSEQVDISPSVEQIENRQNLQNEEAAEQTQPIGNETTATEERPKYIELTLF